MAESTVLTVHAFDVDRHRPGTVGHDEQRCAWGGGCRCPASYSVEADEPAGISWWACCDRHVRGLVSIEGAQVVWIAPDPDASP